MEPVSIAIGAPIGTQPVVADQAAEAAQIRQDVATAGLQLRSLAFVGTDGAAIVQTQAPGAADAVVQDWMSALQQVVGVRPDSAWLFEIDAADGSPIKALANSPSTAGTNGWVEPNLRGLDNQVTAGG